MNAILNATFVIARRDYLATIAKRSFLLFLIAPIVLLLISGGVGLVIGMSAAHKAHRPELVVLATADESSAFLHSYGRLRDQLGDDNFIDTNVEAPAATTAEGQAQQAEKLLTNPDRAVRAVLMGLPNHPQIVSTSGGAGQLRGGINLALSQTEAKSAPPIVVEEKLVDAKSVNVADKRQGLALSAVYILFFLNILLSGMLLSNMVEEKSSKIIEILIAAVPVDAVFFAKLVSMLAISLTAITVWGSVAGIGLFTALHYFPGATPPEPGVGWPLFCGLEVLYFVMNYLLYGSIFLGIGAQANNVREVQIMSMPATILQAMVFAVISLTSASPHGPLAIGAMLFPLSSPLMMIGAAAREATLWPHLLALVWQALWIVIIVRFASDRFRRIVLKSGPSRAKVAV